MQGLIDWTIWQPRDFDLDQDYNILSAPYCECGCGNKMSLLLSDEEAIDLAASVLMDQECGYCAVFIVHPDKYMEIVLRTDDEITVYGGVLKKWKEIGEIFEETELHHWGVFLDAGIYEGNTKKYRILEEV